MHTAKTDYPEDGLEFFHMALRIILTQAGIDNIEKGVPGKADRLNGLSVSSENGWYYMNIHGDPFDPGFLVPEIPEHYIRLVSFTDSYMVGLREDGIYKDGEKGTASVETRGDGPLRHQHISVAGTSIEAVTAMYNKVRNGELKPATRWHLSSNKLVQSDEETDRD
jgi:hypothetical protein